MAKVPVDSEVLENLAKLREEMDEVESRILDRQKKIDAAIGLEAQNATDRATLKELRATWDKSTEGLPDPLKKLLDNEWTRDQIPTTPPRAPSTKPRAVGVKEWVEENAKGKTWEEFKTAFKAEFPSSALGGYASPSPDKKRVVVK